MRASRSSAARGAHDHKAVLRKRIADACEGVVFGDLRVTRDATPTPEVTVGGEWARSHVVTTDVADFAEGGG